MSQPDIMGFAKDDHHSRDLELARRLMEEEEFRLSQERGLSQERSQSQEKTERSDRQSQPIKKQRLSLSLSKDKMQRKSPETKKTDKENVENKDYEPQRDRLKMAERLARQLAELEKKKYDDQRKQRVEEEKFYRSIREKVEEERQKLEENEKAVHQSNKEVYALFNDLQGIAKDLDISFDYPEIVVVGMQSDGKSSFIEGLLGFQFNIVESNIGTRRPLIIQMINDPTQMDPSCRFRRENYNGSGDPFDASDTPVSRLCDEIVNRTNQVAGVSQDSVSAVPIILRVRYCYCANLTIYDTPGFRLGGDERLSNEIKDMVVELIKPRNRILVVLEQSTVEWANTVSRPLVRQIDSDFSRSILVNTKFDNRVKELRSRESAEKYLTGESLPEGVKPFFISMPVRRNLDSSRFKSSMRDAYLDDYQKLLEINFDEEKFLSQLGMFRVKNYLEQLLNRQYQQSLAPTLKTLEDICSQTQREIDQLDSELQMHDLDKLKSKATLFVQHFATTVDNLLAGSIAGDPDKNGQTLNEEKLGSGIQEWPEFNIDFDIPNAKLRIYGGAQYSRLVSEFEYVAHSREFPHPSLSEIASALGTSKMHGMPVFETAAANLVQMKAKHVFLPLIDVLLHRSSFIMKRLFGVAISVIKQDTTNGTSVLTVYERFMEELKRVFEGFIQRTEEDCRNRLKDDFVMFTKIVDWEMINSNPVNGSDSVNFLEVTPEDTKKRVEEIMERKSISWSDGNRITKMDEEAYKSIATIGAKMFSGIRFFFAKYVRNKMNAFFLDPMLQEVGVSIVNHFYRLPDEKYEGLFLDGVAELKDLRERLQTKLVACTQQRDRFKEMYFRMKQQSEERP